MNIRNLQKGFSLTEALVAFAVVGVGLLAVASFQSGLFSESANNKARMEALGLAQEKIEQFKHYTLADETAYIDDNGDGVMDAVGNYSENPINGRNAVFTRSWVLGSTDLGSDVAVTVSWNDTENQLQTVSLNADIPWISPRTAADQVVELTDPYVDAPTGRARRGEGNLADLPSGDLIQFPNIYPDDGMEMYEYGDDLLLVTENDDIVLTLEDACAADSGECTDFVRIAGTVYLDKANTGRMALSEIELLASDAAFCQRWVDSGTLDSPPSTASGDYEYFHYTCYLGGGWHGNIGFVTTAGLQQTDKVCQGDPTSFESYSQPVIAMRRAYRGMISKPVAGVTKYYSHGIKDASLITGQDFVFTSLQTSETQGSSCMAADAPMTRTDSESGTLFAGVPTDFVCLNQDNDGDGVSDYLETYDTSTYSAGTSCPFDPTSPPVQSHEISGAITVNTYLDLDLSSMKVVTSDGLGNCDVWAASKSVGEYTLAYSCAVYDWGNGWSGAVALIPNSEFVFCPSRYAIFTDLTGDASESFRCIGGPTVQIQGPISYLVETEITSITMEEAVTGTFGECEFIASAFRCIAPYDGTAWSGTLSINANNHVCGSLDNTFTLSYLTEDGSPYKLNVVFARRDRECPIELEVYPTPIVPLEPINPEPAIL